MTRFFDDLKFGLRILRRSPAFSLVSIVTLGLGIGLITAVFSLVNAFLLRPMPFEDPDRLVHIWQTDGKIDYDAARMSVPNYEDLRRSSRTFSDMGGYFYGSFVRTGGAEAETLDATWLTPNLLDLLGVPPMIGRAFDEDDSENDAVVLLSHGFWRRSFGGRGDIVGEQLLLDNKPYTVVGVMPESFVFPFNRMDLWTPLSLEPYRDQRDRNGPLLVVGRLADGESPSTGQAELDSLMKDLEREHAATNDRVGANVVDLRSQLLFTWDIFSVVFPVLLLAVAFVVLIVCANLANLLLARGQDREREIAFRLTLGAPRKRLVRQLLTENALLAVVGGALGVVVATWACQVLDRALPGELYRVGQVDVDLATLGFTLLVSLSCVAVFGLVPAFSTTAVQLAEAVRSGGSGNSDAQRSRRLRNTFVVAQVSLAVLLVVGAGLMVKTLQTLRSVDLGFEPARLLTFEVKLPKSSYPDDAQERQYFEAATERIRNVPSVEAVASIYPLPLNHERPGTGFSVPGQPADEQLFASSMWISGDWFEVAGTALLSGRSFNQFDGPDSPPVVIVNHDMETRLWPEQGALGQQIEIRGTRREVVGVVESARYFELDEEPGMMVFYPQRQSSTGRRFVVARTASSPTSSWPAIKAAITSIDPNLPLENVRGMNQVIATWLGPWMMGIGGVGGLGLGALLLAAMGLYGVLRYSVSCRSREFGIRSALGAERRDILRLVVGQGLALTLAGILIGLAGALALTRFLGSLLYGVEALDPATFLVTPAVLLTVAFLASVAPALRATRADPSAALRSD